MEQREYVGHMDRLLPSGPMQLNFSSYLLLVLHFSSIWNTSFRPCVVNLLVIHHKNGPRLPLNWPRTDFATHNGNVALRVRVNYVGHAFRISSIGARAEARGYG